LHGVDGKRDRLSPVITARRLQLPEHLAAVLNAYVWTHHKGTGKELRETITERTEARRTEARRMQAEGYSYGKIAAALDMKLSTLKSLLYRSGSEQSVSSPLCIAGRPLSLSPASALNPFSSSDSDCDSGKSGGGSMMTPTPGALLSAFIVLNYLIPVQCGRPWGTAADIPCSLFDAAVQSKRSAEAAQFHHAGAPPETDTPYSLPYLRA